MGKIVDLSGKTYGKLSVVSLAKISKRAYWLCRCSCGKEIIVSSNNLQTGNTQSCGCSRLGHNNRGTHFKSRTRIFRIWVEMRRRCKDHNRQEYGRYGGRGIVVCDEWQAFEPFYEWALSHDYAENLSIDRIDNNGNYCPENCRWITLEKQQQNRCNNIFFQGKCLAEWCREQNINPTTLNKRLKRGWPIEKAIFTPVKR